MNILLYWLARTAIFVAVLAVLWLVGWRDLLAIIAAAIAAWPISYLLLPTLRARAQEQMDGMIERSQRGIRAAADEEDAELEGDSKGE